MHDLPVIPALAFAFLICFTCYRHMIHPALISPLSKIPNAHFTASFSPLWILYNRWRSNEVTCIHAAHEKHGPIVRLSPNEVSVNSLEGLRLVYAGGFDKHDFYPNLFDNYGIPNMFSTPRSKPHAARKRMLSNIYSKSHLQSSLPAALQSSTIILTRLLPKIHTLASSSPSRTVEVHALMNALTMDLTTAYQFGLSNSSDLLRDDETAAWQFHQFHCRRPYIFWAAELPWLGALLSRVGLRYLPTPRFAVDASRHLEDWGLRMLDAAEAHLTSPSKTTAPSVPEDTPVVYAQLRAALSKDAATTAQPPTKPGDRIPAPNARLSLASEMLDHLGAGQETSSITLTSLLSRLAHDQPTQSALRSEIRTHLPSLASTTPTTTLPPAKEIDTLPLLHAVLTETLRLHAAIPGPQPRVTPSAPSPAAVLHGHSLPGGVRISSQAHTLHRLPSVFRDPEAWDPRRWLSEPDEAVNADGAVNADEAAGEEARREAMRRHLWAFGSGGRMCVGSNLAMQGMKAVAAAVVARFVVLPAPGSEGVVGQEDGYVAEVVGMRCLLRFEEVHGVEE